MFMRKSERNVSKYFDAHQRGRRIAVDDFIVYFWTESIKEWPALCYIERYSLGKVEAGYNDVDNNDRTWYKEVRLHRCGGGEREDWPRHCSAHRLLLPSSAHSHYPLRKAGSALSPHTLTSTSPSPSHNYDIYQTTIQSSERGMSRDKSFPDFPQMGFSSWIVTL